MSEERKYSLSLETTKLAVIGLGYVGLPLAVEFGKCRSVVGFDINSMRIKDLRSGKDTTLEVSNDELVQAENLKFSSNPADLKSCNVFIVTVPTPIDNLKRPNLGPLISASETVGKILKHGDVVIYESTVYPGATEEDCVPILESVSGLQFNVDFFAGYSPERINPGDKTHRLTNITKVTSGSTPEVADFVDALYASIVVAGTHKAASIRVAEAAKVIENTQRDINIALVNELSIIFEKIGIDTEEVLEAAGTKWNFLPFRPGLVGGHCIGVDPYYLTFKSESVGYTPEVILSGRRLNDHMGIYVANKLAGALSEKGDRLDGKKVLVLGLTFKENCPDTRNTKVADLILELQRLGMNVDTYDPWVREGSALLERSITTITQPMANTYDAIVLAVAHQLFIDMGAETIEGWGRRGHVFFDLKHAFPKREGYLRL